ncbi:MAG TPA: IS630 family transposase, partial [Thermodesulfobacteriota bacterium]|nr:IS630 family transposase [Thermodesulfobacteriota bacterium]
MITGRPKAPMLLSEQEQKQLKSIVSSRSLPAGIVSRARIVLMAAEGI